MRTRFLFSVILLFHSLTGSSASCTVVCTHILRVVDDMKIDLDRLNVLMGSQTRQISGMLERIASVVVSSPPPSPPVAPGPPGDPCPPQTPPQDATFVNIEPETSRVTRLTNTNTVTSIFFFAYVTFLLFASSCSFPSRARVLV